MCLPDARRALERRWIDLVRDSTVWLIRRIPDDEGLRSLARVRPVNRDRVAV